MVLSAPLGPREEAIPANDRYSGLDWVFAEVLAIGSQHLTLAVD